MDIDLIKSHINKMMVNDIWKNKGMKDVSLKGLRRSLEKIGGGDIIEKSEYNVKGDRLMYKEFLNDDSLILVVHGSYKKDPYYGKNYGYEYSIGLFRNNHKITQYGGGYGASGFVEKQHTQLLGYTDYNYLHFNEDIISEVCNYIKSKIGLNEGVKKKIIIKESELISLIERMINEYGEDSGGQDMTWGLYKRDSKGLSQSIDFKMMSPHNVALEIESELPENYNENDVSKAIDNYIENASINMGVAKKYMQDENWWETLYYNINDIRRKNEVKEGIIRKGDIKKLEEETSTNGVGSFQPSISKPIRKKIKEGLTKEEFIELKRLMKMDEIISEGKKKTGTPLCARGKAAAKAKFKVYPSAYSSGFAVQVCKGRMPGLDGKKRCSGAYC